MNSSVTINKTRKAKKSYSLLIFIIPAFILAFTFCYIPMSGLIMAFKGDIDLSAYKSPIAAIIMAENVGLTQFKILFEDPLFLSALANTLLISLLKIVIVFPIPIFLALMITEVKNKLFSRSLQSIMYLPHFLSWAIVASIFTSFMRLDEGALNIILTSIGFNEINISSADQFRGIVVFTYAWKDVGWSAVVYISAIVAIDQEQFESAKMDGANKFHQAWYITLPSIAGTIAVLLVMRIGYLMDAGFEQIYAMLTPTAESAGQIVGTLIYDLSIKKGGSYAFSTAAGLFNSVVSLILVLGGNVLCKKVFNRGII